MQNIPERLAQETEILHKIHDRISHDIRVAAPGIIKSFNASTQTVSVQIAIREKMNLDGKNEWKEIPLLVDVPIFMPRAGGYALTLPISAGDECLVVFGDACMDAWWQSGGVQNQMDKRRHDLSDGYAIVGIWSQPRKATNYSGDAAQLRTDDGENYIELKGGTIKLVSDVIEFHAGAFRSYAKTGSGGVGSMQLNAETFTVSATTSASIAADGQTSIEGRNFIAHEHKDVQTGSDNTGGVV